MNNDVKKPFDEWCLLELFGHSRIAGKVTETSIGGGTFIRVDVPDASGEETLFTRYYNPSAIYGISPVSKQTAIGLAQNIDSKPVRPFDIVKRIQEGQPSLIDHEQDQEHDY